MSVSGGRALVCGIVGLTALAGCAGTQDDAAASAARAFASAVEQQDGERACALLAAAARQQLQDSSGKPCPEAVLEEDVGSGSAIRVEVYDSMAQVRLASGTMFLSQFDGDWLVVGAACTPQPGDRPYDCGIEVS